MNGSQKLILGAMTAIALIAGAPAFAHDNGGHGRWHDDKREHYYSYNRPDNQYKTHHENEYTHYNYQRNVDRPDIIKIYDRDRVILIRYVQDKYKRSKPREWSKNHHQYRHHGEYNEYQPNQYVVGYPLPDDVTYYSVPYEVRSHLRPTPIGYQYIRVDNDVLLMNSASKQIVDAVTLLSSFDY